MEYTEELARLEENEKNSSSDYWKPTAGTYKVKALSEIEESSPFEKEGEDPQQRRQVKLLVNNEEVVWTFPFGITPASTYGQLVNLGSAKTKLTDLEFIIVVTGSEKTKRYTVVA